MLGRAVSCPIRWAAGFPRVVRGVPCRVRPSPSVFEVRAAEFGRAGCHGPATVSKVRDPFASFFDDALFPSKFFGRPWGVWMNELAAPIRGAAANSAAESESAVKSLDWVPRMDISESPDRKSFRVHLEVPGVEKSDLSISVQENILTVKGERKFSSSTTSTSPESVQPITNVAAENASASNPTATTTDSAVSPTATASDAVKDAAKHKDKDTEKIVYHRIERVHGTFARSIQLPEGTDTRQITASFRNGVLDLVIPKVEPAVPPLENIPIQ